MSFRPMSPDHQKIVKQGYCPRCKSNDLEGGFVEVDCDSAWQKVHCNNCGHYWNEVYTYAFAEEEVDED